MTDLPSVASADRFRLIVDATRLRDQARDAQVRATEDRTAEVQRREEIIAEQVRVQEDRIRLRRNDLEADEEVRSILREQQRFADVTASDDRFFEVQSLILEELNSARDDRAAIEALIERGVEEDIAFALVEEVQLDAAPLTPTQPNFQDQLAAREERLADTRAEQRDLRIQQQIDLRLADDRVSTAVPNGDLPRGSLVDVLG